MKSLGEIALDAFIKAVSEEGYCKSCADWVHLSEVYKEGWQQAARAVAEEVCRSDVQLPLKDEDFPALNLYESWVVSKEKGE